MNDDPTSQAGSQGTFEETPYEDSQWEVIGALEENPEFQPLSVEAISRKDLIVDPMFADYGGIPEKTQGRYHLPESEVEKIRALEGQANSENSVTDAEEDLLKLRQEELEKIRAEAFEQGRTQALEESSQKQTEKLQAIESRIGTICDDIGSQISRQKEKMEREALDLVISLAKKIIDEAVEVNPEYLLPVLKEGIELSGSATIRRIRVSPQDMEFIEVMGVRQKLESEEHDFEFVGDPSIKAGCVVETSAGEVDFDLDKAWERVKKSIIQVAR